MKKHTMHACPAAGGNMCIRVGVCLGVCACESSGFCDSTSSVSIAHPSSTQTNEKPGRRGNHPASTCMPRSIAYCSEAHCGTICSSDRSPCSGMPHGKLVSLYARGSDLDAHIPIRRHCHAEGSVASSAGISRWKSMRRAYACVGGLRQRMHRLLQVFAVVAGNAGLPVQMSTLWV